MRVRLRHSTTRRSGAKAVREETIDVGRLRIGRAAEAEIHLPGLTVALEHAIVELRDGRVWIESVGGDEIRVNDRLTRGRVLHPGDLVRIAHYELRLLPSEPDTDAVVEIEQVDRSSEPKSDGLRARSRLGTGGGLLTVRRVSVLLFLAVAGAALAVPLVADRAADEDDMPLLREVAGRVEATWSVGPLAFGHAHLASDCRSCHVDTFARVPDRACAECHANVGAHVSTESEHRSIADARCGSCHLEHRGEHGLATFGDATCVGCHVGLPASESDTAVREVADFAAEHPAFRPAVVVELGSALRERMPLSSTVESSGDERALREQSGLRFPHAKHLVERLRAPIGEVTLVCGDCHAPGPSGETMEPIRFDDQCRRCHSLSFDELHKQREALHAEPALVGTDLYEFYAGLALDGEANDPQAPPVARRRPGREITETERLGVAAWAKGRAQTAGAMLMADEGPCGECHFVTSDGEAVSVVPVHVVPFDGADRWLLHARFRHRAHAAVECEDCHSVRQLQTSEAVALPAIETCRKCHAGDEGALGKVRSPCALCHDFHRTELGPMRASAQEPAGG